MYVETKKMFQIKIRKKEPIILFNSLIYKIYCSRFLHFLNLFSLSAIPIPFKKLYCAKINRNDYDRR